MALCPLCGGLHSSLSFWADGRSRVVSVGIRIELFPFQVLFSVAVLDSFLPIGPQLLYSGLACACGCPIIIIIYDLVVVDLVLVLLSFVPRSGTHRTCNSSRRKRELNIYPQLLTHGGGHSLNGALSLYIYS